MNKLMKQILQLVFTGICIVIACGWSNGWGTTIRRPNSSSTISSITYNGTYTSTNDTTNVWWWLTSVGTVTVTGTINIEATLVGGGGAGGNAANTNSTGSVGGGGGAGGVVISNISLNAGSYVCVIGDGGISTNPLVGNVYAGNTTFNGMTAFAGGNGGGYDVGSDASTNSLYVMGWGGASGGGGKGGNSSRYGCGGTNIPDQGYIGGRGIGGANKMGGGGGGFLGPGIMPTNNTTGGNGGAGYSTSICGVIYYYAGGGGGACPNTKIPGYSSYGGGCGASNAVSATAPTAFSGSGGGGGCEAGGTNTMGASGVVIIRYSYSYK